MKDKLILLDVFSYSCMNCLRSVRYIKKLDEKYKNFGLVTKIIHPPEWEFEKNRKNIEDFLKQQKINFPLTLDSKRKIINGFGVNFWPSQILVKNKKVIYVHVGEGDYKKLEEKIVEALDIKDLSVKKLFNLEPKYSKYPTLYCGKRKNGKIILLENSKNKFYFGDIYSDENWIQESEFLRSVEDGCLLTLPIKGKEVNFVAESLTKKPIIVKIKSNEMVEEILIDKPKMYNLLSFKDDKKRNLTLIAEKNLAIYSFSFQ